MYDIQEQDIDSVIDRSQLSAVTQPFSVQMQLPILELLKVCCMTFSCLSSYMAKNHF